MPSKNDNDGRTVLLGIFLCAFCFASVAAEPVKVGLRKQLFVDNYIVDSMKNITRRLGKVTKANDGKPIFTEGWFYGTVLYDDGRFKLWWRKPGKCFGFAESRDGIRFSKVADVTGINFAGDYTLSVMIDPHETEAVHRFKAAYDAPGMAAGLAHSADGIRWTPYNNGRPVTHRAADTYNQIVWDEDAKTYRLFTRTDFGTAGGVGEFRGTRSMTNPDVRAQPAKWRKVRDWVFGKGKSEAGRRQIYALTDWIYHGVHFALMSVYEWPGDFSEGKTTDHVNRHERDVMNYYLATSRDGDKWDLRWVYAGQPIVPRGPDRAFDKDIVLPASTIVTHADEHWLYYAGANERHGGGGATIKRDHAIGLARLRLDGFVALEAKKKMGVVVTKPFRLDGTKLEVNVDARGGHLRVEVLNADGKPLPKFSGFAAKLLDNADKLRHQPGWPSKLSALNGKPIRLRFTLHNARLYSFRVISK